MSDIVWLWFKNPPSPYTPAYPIIEVLGSDGRNEFAQCQPDSGVCYFSHANGQSQFIDPSVSLEEGTAKDISRCRPVNSSPIQIEQPPENWSPRKDCQYGSEPPKDGRLIFGRFQYGGGKWWPSYYCFYFDNSWVCITTAGQPTRSHLIRLPYGWMTEWEPVISSCPVSQLC